MDTDDGRPGDDRGSALGGLLPPAARRTAAWCAVVLLVSGVAGLTIWLCIVLEAVVTPVLLALLGSALLGPLHRRLLAMRVQQSLAAGLTCVMLVAFGAGAGYIVVYSLMRSGDQILSSLKNIAQQVATRLGAPKTSLDDTIDGLKSFVTRYGAEAASGVLSGLSVVGRVIAAAILALLLTFFFLRDGHKVPGALRSFAPGLQLERVARRGFAVVEGFMRGTTLIALIDAVCITTGLLILRVPGAVGLGALVFVGAYIPYLGAFLSGSVAVLVALADRGFVIALWALGVILAVQVLEGHVLQPLIQSRTVQIHPAMVLIAIAAGASIAGILGMLLAVPIAAAAFGVLAELRGPSHSDAAPSAAPSAAPKGPRE